MFYRTVSFRSGHRHANVVTGSFIKDTKHHPCPVKGGIRKQNVRQPPKSLHRKNAFASGEAGTFRLAGKRSSAACICCMAALAVSCLHRGLHLELESPPNRARPPIPEYRLDPTRRLLRQSNRSTAHANWIASASDLIRERKVARLFSAIHILHELALSLMRLQNWLNK